MDGGSCSPHLVGPGQSLFGKHPRAWCAHLRADVPRWPRPVKRAATLKPTASTYLIEPFPDTGWPQGMVGHTRGWLGGDSVSGGRDGEGRGGRGRTDLLRGSRAARGGRDGARDGARVASLPLPPAPRPPVVTPSGGRTPGRRARARASNN